MKAPGSAPNQQQRKEANGKEITVMYLKRSNIDRRDQEEPRVWRAAIYLCEPDAKNGVTEPTVAEQRKLCRQQAKSLQVKVVGEFVDTREYGFLRPWLHEALETAQEQRLDYMIVWSLDLLADLYEDAFEVAWRLGHAGTIPMPVYEDN
jgi:hypothetical protein